MKIELPVLRSKNRTNMRRDENLKPYNPTKAILSSGYESMLQAQISNSVSSYDESPCTPKTRETPRIPSSSYAQSS
jgi:hypothetical protein